MQNKVEYTRAYGFLTRGLLGSSGSIADQIGLSIKEIKMPCGAVFDLTGKDRRCPHQGQCGAKECWIEKYE